jgi:hypothetical protein
MVFELDAEGGLIYGFEETWTEPLVNLNRAADDLFRQQIGGRSGLLFDFLCALCDSVANS